MIQRPLKLWPVSQLCRNYLLPVVSCWSLNRKIEGTAFCCITRKFLSDLSPCTMAWFDFQCATRVIALSLSFLFLAMMPSVVLLKCQKRNWISCFRYFYNRNLDLLRENEHFEWKNRTLDKCLIHPICYPKPFRPQWQQLRKQIRQFCFNP